MKKIYLSLISAICLMSLNTCEELGLDLRKVEFTINGEVTKIKTFDTYKIDYAVLWNRADILSVFDISNEAEIKNFWIKDFNVYYQACDVIEAQSLDLKLFISEPIGGLTGLAFLSGIDLKKLEKTVDPREPFNLNLTKLPGGVKLLNDLLGGMIQDESKFINIIVEGEHHPAESLVCGAILIKMDVYIQYEECRLVPFTSTAGDLCE